jgi:hypothetical protein
MAAAKKIPAIIFFMSVAGQQILKRRVKSSRNLHIYA